MVRRERTRRRRRKARRDLLVELAAAEPPAGARFTTTSTRRRRERMRLDRPARKRVTPCGDGIAHRNHHVRFADDQCRVVANRPRRDCRSRRPRAFRRRRRRRHRLSSASRSTTRTTSPGRTCAHASRVRQPVTTRRREYRLHEDAARPARRDRVRRHRSPCADSARSAGANGPRPRARRRRRRRAPPSGRPSAQRQLDRDLGAPDSRRTTDGHEPAAAVAATIGRAGDGPPAGPRRSRSPDERVRPGVRLDQRVDPSAIRCSRLAGSSRSCTPTTARPCACTSATSARVSAGHR